MFDISTSNKDGKLNRICSVSTFIYYCGITFKISSFTLHISFDRFSCFFSSPGYSLMRQTDFWKIFFFFNQKKIISLKLSTFCLINSLSVNDLFFAIRFAITQLGILKSLNYKFFKKKRLLRWQTFLSSTILSLLNTPWCASNQVASFCTWCIFNL